MSGFNDAQVAQAAAELAAARRAQITPQATILRYFEFGHLPPALAEVSMEFQIIAEHMDDLLPNGPEKSVCLRKLLEAKDAAVRAALDLEAGL